MSLKWLTGTLVAAAAVVIGGSVEAGPPFWGATHAYVIGPDDPAGMTGGRPVHVAALMPPELTCWGLAGARLDDPPPYPRVIDSLRAARVVVSITPGACPPTGKDNWLRFTVAHPYQADILQLVYVGPDGRVMGGEKVSIASGAGGPQGR